MSKPKTLNSVKPREAEAVEPVEEKAEAVETAKETPAEETEKPRTLVEATRFDVPALRRVCFKTFGVTMSTFDGAFYGKEDGHYTIDETRSIIEEFLKGEIKA
ncbi:MAG: hypothetical protein ILP16_09720 [Spirochaetales bacterium]|jgi:hypothetical protein|nr:hypothetical protein [Spirochaetales bacterium]